MTRSFCSNREPGTRRATGLYRNISEPLCNADGWLFHLRLASFDFAALGPSHYARTKACVEFVGPPVKTPIQSGLSIGITSFKMLGSKSNGGEGGIRTPGTLSGTPVFKTGGINHSATSPGTRMNCLSILLLDSIVISFLHRFPLVYIRGNLSRLELAEGSGVEFHDFSEVG